MAESILVVEDSARVGEALGFVLRAEGYDVSLVADGAQGLAKLAGTRPCVILLDALRPQPEAATFVEAVRASECCADTPIVAFTAGGSATDPPRRLARELHLQGFLDAGFGLAELRAVLSSVRRSAESSRARLRTSRETVDSGWDTLSAARERLGPGE
jgi:CheY-like chemotaxis protein